MSPLTALERLELLELYSRYAHAIDANDGTAWIECWTDDGVFVPGVGAETAGWPVRGHQALMEFAASRPDGYKRARILTVNHLFERVGDEVHGKAYALVLDVSSQSPRLAAHVVYHDVIVRDDDQWKFASRHPIADVEDLPEQ